MASNDMNSWDEDPDELLRQRWQQLFDDFEVQPRLSLSQRILAPLLASHRRRRTRWVAVVGLLLLISGGLVYQVRFGTRAELVHGKTTRIDQATPTSSLPANRIRSSSIPIGHPAPSKLPTTNPQPDLAVLERPSITRSPTPHDAKVFEVEVSTKRHSITKSALVNHPRLRSLADVTFRTPTKQTNKSDIKSARSVDTKPSVQSFNPVETRVGHKPASEPIAQSIHDHYSPLPTPQSATIHPLARDLSTDWAWLKPLGNLTLPSQLSALPDQIPSIKPVLSYPAKATVSHRGPHWFVDAIPLSSFQWMNAPPSSTGYLSQVHGPAAFSPATWGYQINGGFRFQRWQAYVTVGQLRRWAYYTVNENRYYVEPNPTNPTQLIRETYTVSEDVALPMIGAGLSQQTLLAHGRYAVEYGGQISYLPTGAQALAGLRGGVGRRLVLNQTLGLQIGLTVEYGVNRLQSEQKQLAIHPLVIGVGLRIQPRSGDHN